MDEANPRWQPPPWEPPLAGSELDHLIGSLERMRTTFRWKADGLDAAALAARGSAGDLTLGSLLKHLAVVEDFVLTTKLRGLPLGDPWDPAAWDDDQDWEFHSAAEDSPAELYGCYDDAVERARTRLTEALAHGGLDQPADISAPDGRHPSLRRLLFDLIEEYARHTGHADLIREGIDGLVGEDPPDDWRPQSGNYRLP